MTVVLDASAVLATLLEEPGASTVVDLLGEAVISTVNLCEVAQALVRRGNNEAQSRSLIAALEIRAIDADVELALDSAFLRRRTERVGLSLGDRFCLALGRRLAAPVLTTDRAWRQVADSCEVEVRLIR